MSNQHTLTISATKYPNGLRIVECASCSYAFAAEINAHGMIDVTTKVPINQGDTSAAHSLFQTPEIKLELSVGAEL